LAKSGLKHIDVGAELTKTEWESEESHEVVHGTSFPSSPVERQLFYRDDEHKWYIYNASAWVWLGGGGGGMAVHGNEYHDPDFAEASHTHAQLHTQGTDTALGAVGTKNPPIDADKALYRDSESSDALKTSTWTQIKAFLKTYFDTLYATLSHTHGQLHDRLHSITSTSDHSSSATSGKMLKADGNGLPVNATNTDTEVSDAVTKKHTQLCEAADFTKLDGIEAGADVTANHAPQAHKTSHQSGGGDAIKLDDLAEPDDNTDLNASTSKHGLLAKLGGGTSNFLRADGAWAAPPGGGGGTKIQDTDADTKVDVEESADEDKIRMAVKGVEAFLLNDAGVLTLAKQSGCRAYQSPNQTIPAATPTKVNLNLETYDTQSEYNVGTYKFVAKTAGLYLVVHQGALFKTGGLADGTLVAAYIKQNGVYVGEADLVLGGAISPTWQCTAILQLAVNDYLEAFIYHNDTVGTVQTYSPYDVLFVAKIA
jgi:hypothetical protein